MKRILLIFASIFISSLCFGDTYPKNPNIDVLHYAFRIELSDDTDEIKCEETVDVRYLADGVEWLRLDLVKASAALQNKGMRVSGVLSNGRAVVFTHENEELKIKLPFASRANERQQYTITYAGTPASGLKIGNNKYGDRTFFSDNWPDKGRNWLAVVDHPYDKATCEFIVTAPAHYQVVSNGLRVEVSDVASDLRVTHWKQSVPIASWLYVLGVARFAMQYVDEFDHKSIETWVYHQDREAGFKDFAEPTKKVLAFYSDYIGPFAYEKLANIQSNSVSGGMEAASAILYSENSVVGDKNERWRNVVIHEIAHQWFGNAVTEYDWDDVWLSEGFATYFTLLFIEHEYGHDAFMEGLASSKKRVDVFYAENPAYRIVHDDLSDMSKVTSSQTYQKGSWILHMLRGVMGTDDFWKGIQSYYKKYQNLNATTADFRREMEEASGLDLKQFFDQWLYQPGHLVYRGSWIFDKKTKEVNITLDQVQTDGSLFKMPVQVGVFLPGQSRPVINTLQVNEKTNVFTLQFEVMPEKIVLDPHSWVLMESSFVKK
ncbi:M1 family aminopeptidase [uncultured Imperialibacter sp.]|uniref:M1 family metallopeptidase n=1 Tax=uncultured Imperialibacter sp. TaxID=1672639 RepID=UPI0030DA524E|tara:strand:+ start:2679 stop:4313 length:1635 start_codon:yes stop_codon:yes gene_type:complete